MTLGRYHISKWRGLKFDCYPQEHQIDPALVIKVNSATGQFSARSSFNEIGFKMKHLYKYSNTAMIHSTICNTLKNIIPSQP